MFSGLSAFPLTPLHHDQVDEDLFKALVARCSAAGVDSITVLGSTGSYAYLDASERARVVEMAVESALSTPVFAGIGALRTSHVLRNAHAAERAGALGLLLAPMTYQALSDDEVYDLYRAVSDSCSLPIIVYDNPTTSHFSFSLSLYERVSAIPGIASIKIPPVPKDLRSAKRRVQSVRQVLPPTVTLGVSGDGTAASGLQAGCDIWYSVIGGTLPQLAMTLTQAIRDSQGDGPIIEVDRLRPLWQLYADMGGSLRVVTAIAEILGLARPDSLPLPIKGITAQQRRSVEYVVNRLDLAG